MLPLSAPSVDPKFLSGNYGSTASQQANQEAVAGTGLSERYNLLNESVDLGNMSNVSIDLDNTPEKDSVVKSYHNNIEEGPYHEVGPSAHLDALTHAGHSPVAATNKDRELSGEQEGGKNTLKSEHLKEVEREIKIDGEGERERLVQEKYRRGIEERLSQSEAALSSKDKELRTLRETLASSQDEVRRGEERHSRQVAELEAKLRVAEATITERSNALERVSTMGGVSSEQSESFRKAMEEQDAEIMRLQGYLQESEDRLKEHEELTWAAKAEQAELARKLDAAMLKAQNRSDMREAAKKKAVEADEYVQMQKASKIRRHAEAKEAKAMLRKQKLQKRKEKTKANKKHKRFTKEHVDWLWEKDIRFEEPCLVWASD